MKNFACCSLFLNLQFFLKKMLETDIQSSFIGITSKKITLSPRGDKEEEDEEEFTEPIIMKEEILIDAMNDISFTGSEMQASLEPMGFQFRRRIVGGQQVPAKSLELKGVDNSKLSSGVDKINNIKKKHERLKAFSPVRTKPSDFNGVTPAPTKTLVHVPLEELSSRKVETNTTKGSKKSTKQPEVIDESQLNIEITKERAFDESPIQDHTSEIIVNVIRQEPSDFSDNNQSDGLDVFKSKVIVPDEILDITLETKRMMEEDVSNMKSNLKKVSLSTQLDYFKRKSREVLSEPYKNHIFALDRRKYTQVMLKKSNSSGEEVDFEKKDESYLSLKLPQIDKKRKKRKTKKDLSPEKYAESAKNDSFKQWNNSIDMDLQETDFYDGSEELGIVDEVIKVASAKSVPQIPRSKIPKKYHIIEKSPIVTKEELEKQAVYNGDKRVWETTVFPSNKPVSRMEVVQLARTFELMLEEMNDSSQEHESLVEEEMRVLDTISSEISRQISVQCAERGILLNRVIYRFKKLVKKSVQAKEEAKQKIEGITSSNEHKTSALIEFYTDSIKSKEEILKKKEDENAELVKQIAKLKEQLRQTRKGIKAITSNFFTEKLMQEMVTKSLQVTPREPTPRNTEKLFTEEELKQKLEEMMAKEAELTISTVDRGVNTSLMEGVSLESVRAIERYNSLFATDYTVEVVEETPQQVEESEVTEETQTETKEDKPVEEKKEEPPVEIVYKDRDGNIISKERYEYLQKLSYGLVKDIGVQFITFSRPPMPPSNSIATQTLISEIKTVDEIDRMSPNSSLEFNNSKSGETNPRRTDDYNSRGTDSQNGVRSANSKRALTSEDFKHRMKLVKPEDIFLLFKEILESDKKTRKQSLRWLNRVILEVFNELTVSDFLYNTTGIIMTRKFVYDYFLLKFGLPSIALTVSRTQRIQMIANCVISHAALVRVSH